MSESDLDSFMQETQSTIGTTSGLNYQYDDIGDDQENESLFLNYEISTESVLNDQMNKTNRFESLLSPEESNDESHEFRIMIVCIGLLIVSIGILSNLIFSLLIVCRKRNRPTSSTLLMSSMCLAYLIFLIFYCLKISIYFNVETVIKFHIYDITENWIYGAFLCKFISGLPICCKLISRLSIFALVFKRILSRLICNDCEQTSYANSQDLLNDNDQVDLNVNILNKKRKTRSESKKSKKQQPVQMSKCAKFRHLFECPILLLVVILIWSASLAASWPVFSSFKLTEISDSAICDSVYDFPSDIRKYSSIYFHYLIYALAVPCSLILTFLIILFILQFTNIGLRNSSSASSSSQSTPSKNSSINKQNSSIKERSNNLLLWVIFIIHLASSLPQELYRYLQLISNDFSDKTTIESYLEMTMIKPLIRARSYYSMQLLYISEFALIPLVFILFFTCTSRTTKNLKSENNNILSNNRKNNKVNNCLTMFFYDNDLIKANQKNIYIHNTNDQSLSDALLDDSQHMNSLQVNDSKMNFNARKASNSSSLKPTPFELASNGNTTEQTTFGYNNSNGDPNVLHIIQHPSWRINIKQPTTPTSTFQANNNNNNNHNFNDDTKGSVQLPFNYVKTNMYNS